MKVSDPLLKAWGKTLARKGDLPAILGETGNPLRSFRQIEKRSDELAPHLGQLRPGEVVGVQIGNHPDWPSVFLACLRRQLVTVPLDRSISAQERDAAVGTCHINLLISQDANQTANGKLAALHFARFDHPPIDWGQYPPVLLKLTSGTTAAPRAVRFRSQQLIADCIQICDTMGISDADLNFGVIPVSHSYGFSNLLTPLLVRGVPLVLSSDRLPRAVIANIDRSGATVFAGMPVFYQAFNEMTDVPRLHKLRLCISAGAPLTPAVAQRFHEQFRIPIHTFYGSSECGGICYDRAGTDLETGFVGAAMNSVNIELTDPTAKADQIRVMSAAVSDGYFPEPNESKLGSGVFVPDDLLTACDKGWKIVGRVSDVINVAGKKVNPAEVEAELLNVPGVREAIVFGRKSSLRHEEVAACVVVNSDVSENELLKICRQRLSGWQVPKRIFLLDQLPVNERGKVSRRELAAQFAER